MDDEALPPELAGMSPREALWLRGNSDAIGAWLRQHGLAAVPRHFFGVVARLADEAESTDEEARRRAADATPANRRRRDLARMRHMFAHCERSLAPREREAFALCIDQGRSIAEAARLMDIAPSTVRTYIKRMREIVKRNPHVRIPTRTG
jgi:DNA-directed RNA polymerase specialized sigma24 family protein